MGRFCSSILSLRELGSGSSGVGSGGIYKYCTSKEVISVKPDQCFGKSPGPSIQIPLPLEKSPCLLIFLPKTGDICVLSLWSRASFLELWSSRTMAPNRPLPSFLGGQIGLMQIRFSAAVQVDQTCQFWCDGQMTPSITSPQGYYLGRLNRKLTVGEVAQSLFRSHWVPSNGLGTETSNNYWPCR